MRTIWTIALALAALAVPVSALAVVDQTDYKHASQFCKALRADMGVPTFKQTYGTNKNRSNALGKCVSAKQKAAESQQQDTIVSAAKSCRTERNADPGAFRDKYGTNHNKRNAFGKCVSKLVSKNEQHS
jgi:hypothetical protein